jgi:hypothetical protein
LKENIIEDKRTISYEGKHSKDKEIGNCYEGDLIKRKVQ